MREGCMHGRGEKRWTSLHGRKEPEFVIYGMHTQRQINPRHFRPDQLSVIIVHKSSKKTTCARQEQNYASCKGSVLCLSHVQPNLRCVLPLIIRALTKKTKGSETCMHKETEETVSMQG